MDDDEDLSRYSGKPLTAEEYRRIRRDLALLEQVRPIITMYQNGRVIGRFALIMGAWILGAMTSMLGIFGGLRFLNWWPFNGGGS